MTIFEGTLLALFTSVLAGGGYLIKRKIERRPQIEELEYQERLLKLKDSLSKNEGITTEVKHLTQQAFSNPHSRQRGTIRFHKDLEERLEKASTQADMNEVAMEAARRARESLDDFEERIVDALGSERKGPFRDASKAWRVYAEQQANFVASEYHGGSIVPLIAYTEMYHLAEQRYEQLELIWQEIQAE